METSNPLFYKEVFGLKKVGSVLLVLFCAVLIAGLSVFGTLAYLTDRDSAVNTFTVGQVSISLEETDVDKDGDTKANKYHIVPGGEYVKDPAVTIKAGSEESYVRMIMTVYNASAVQAIIDDEKNGLTDYTDLFGGWDDKLWLYQDFTVDEEADTISFEFRYKDIVDGYDDSGAEAAQKLPPLFTTVKVPGTLSREEMGILGEDFKIVIEAHAIQAAGFEADADRGLTAADVAWAGFDEQVKR